MLSWIYLAALLVSVLGQVLLDQRWHLFFWRDWRRAAGTLGLGLAFFIAWDLVGIHLGVFFKGHSPFVLGVNLAPEHVRTDPVPASTPDGIHPVELTTHQAGSCRVNR